MNLAIPVQIHDYIRRLSSMGFMRSIKARNLSSLRWVSLIINTFILCSLFSHVNPETVYRIPSRRSFIMRSAFPL